LAQNPVAFQDEFWHFFLVIWMIGFSFVSKWNFAYFPGTQPLNYYVCLGINPIENSGFFSPKQNHLMRLLQVCTVSLQVLMYIRIEKFRRKGNSSKSFHYGSWSESHYLDKKSNFLQVMCFHFNFFASHVFSCTLYLLSLC
jgi:hypothetical protein